MGTREPPHRRGEFIADDRTKPLLPVSVTVGELPFVWMVATSFKTLPEIVAHPTAPMPERLDMGAYQEVFRAIPVARYMAVTLCMASAIATAQCS